MGLPIWITKSGNLGTIPESQYYNFDLEVNDSVDSSAPILFELVAGQMPVGIHIDSFGSIAGNPITQTNVLGVPSNVSQAVTSKFAIRARTPDYFTTFVGDGSTTRFTIPTHIDFNIYNVIAFQNGLPISTYYEVNNTQTNNVTIIFVTIPTLGSNLTVGLYSLSGYVSDRTFELTVVGENAPQILTPVENIGEYFEGTYVEFSIDLVDLDNDTVTLTVVNGSLPAGLSISSTGVISGYISPINFPSNSTIDYLPVMFSVLADDGKLQDLHNFEIDIYPAKLRAANNTLTTIDSNFVPGDMTTKHSPIIYNPAGEIGPVKHDNYFMYKFNGFDYDGDVIAYTYDFGDGEGFDQIDAPFDEVNFDVTVNPSVTGSLPPNLTLDPNTGWLYGYLAPQSELSVTYVFYVRAYKKYYTEQSDPQGGPAVYYYSTRKEYSLTITGQQPGILTWISPSNLGTIENGGISEFQIKATVDNGHTLYYKLTSGAYNRVPSAMQLQSDGLIVGRASFATFSIDGGLTTFDVKNQFVTSPTTFDQNFSFQVEAYDLEGTVSSIKTFTITILKQNKYPYEDLYLVGRLPLDQRTKLSSIINNTHLIPIDEVYRYGDTYFGLQDNLRMLVVNGLNPTPAANYISVMETMHYRKKLLLGDVKSAVVVDSNYNTVYEVVYIEVIDRTDAEDGTPVNSGVDISHSNVPGQTVAYPNNIINMRRNLVKLIGQLNRELPGWMSSRQSNGKVLGFTLGCVLAYVLPGKGSKIAYQLNNLKNLALDHPYYIDFKKILLDVDRYIWDTELTANFNKTTLKFSVENETLFDIHTERFPPTISDGSSLPVYPFNSTILIGDHYGSEYVLNPASTPRATRTTFDGDSMHFVSGRDQYSPQDVNDKYLMFPRTNILQ